jgi:hypothetical protein
VTIIKRKLVCGPGKVPFPHPHPPPGKRSQEPQRRPERKASSMLNFFSSLVGHNAAGSSRNKENARNPGNDNGPAAARGKTLHGAKAAHSAVPVSTELASGQSGQVLGEVLFKSLEVASPCMSGMTRARSCLSHGDHQGPMVSAWRQQSLDCPIRVSHLVGM